MPVLSPTFDPAQAPDTGEEIQLQSGQNNWMTQAAQRAQMGATLADTQAQTEQRQAQTNQLLAYAPALAAKNQADIATATNDVASATAQQQLRGQWQDLKPQVVADLGQLHNPNNIPKEADGTPDWNAIYNSYEGLQAKYGALALLPEGKQYYQMIEDGKKNAFEMAATHATAQLTLDRLKIASNLTLNNKIAGQDNQANLNTQVKPAIQQTEATNTQRNQAFTDISSQRDMLSKQAFSLSNLAKDIKSEQSSPTSMFAARVLGPTIAGVGSSSVKQVNSDIGDFANQIMSTVKNIRNKYEYNAVTGSLVKADDQADVQNNKLNKLTTINQIMTQRNDTKEQILRSNPSLSPDQADQQAANQYPFPSSIIIPEVLKNPPANLSPSDAAAFQWAKGNPKDPRAAVVLQRLSQQP